MLQLRSRAIRNIKITIERTKNFVIKHWFAYNLLTIGYLMIGIPVLALGARASSEILWAFMVPFIALSIPSILELFEAADVNPSGFIMAEKLKDWINALFWLLFAILFGCLALIWIFAELNVQEELILKAVQVFSWTVLFFLANSSYQALHMGTVLISRALYKTKARVYFRVFSDALSSVNLRDQTKKLSFFRNGMKYYNDYLKRRFGFVVHEPQRYFNYVKLAVVSERRGRIEHIKEWSENLGDLLRAESNLLSLHSSMKAIVGESVLDSEDMTEDFDFEVGIRKWVSSHKEAIVFAISLGSLIVASLTLLFQWAYAMP